jgi:hypothetical protein
MAAALPARAATILETATVGTVGTVGPVGTENFGLSVADTHFPGARFTLDETTDITGSGMTWRYGCGTTMATMFSLAHSFHEQISPHYHRSIQRQSQPPRIQNCTEPFRHHRFERMSC